MLKKLIAGQPRRHDRRLARLSVAKLASLLGVAEAALDVAKDHAAQQRSARCGCSGAACHAGGGGGMFAIGMMLLVSRRVTMPLQPIQGAMLKLADGDFGVAVPGLERKDEIGAMANAVERFKAVADEKARREADEATQRSRPRAAVQAKARGGARAHGRTAGAGLPGAGGRPRASSRTAT